MDWIRAISIAMLFMMLLPVGASAQEAKTDSTTLINGKPVPTKYIPTKEDMKQTFFQGFTVSADLLGAGMYLFSNCGNLEAALRLNLLNTYFPIAELGIGRCNEEDFSTKARYKTNAPYMKVGVDYNILKDKWQSNKLYVGLRYGLTRFNYSISGREQKDPIWGGEEPFEVKSIGATSHYGEVVFGCQVKIWSIIHMGWSVRYKSELHTTKSIYSHPYYIPGYGKTTNTSNWGVTYNLSFDLNWGKKKPTIKDIIETNLQGDATPNAEEQPQTADENEEEEETPAEEGTPAEEEVPTEEVTPAEETRTQE